MSDSDMNSAFGTTNDDQTTSNEQSLNPIDRNAFINTFRDDSTSEEIQTLVRQEKRVEDLSIVKQLEGMRV